MSTIFKPTSKSKRPPALHDSPGSLSVYIHNQSSLPRNIQFQTWNQNAILDSITKQGLPPILSPTLPACFTSGNRGSGKSKASDSPDDDDYDIPKMMLSPTLPTAFDRLEKRLGKHKLVMSYAPKTLVKLVLSLPPKLLRQVIPPQRRFPTGPSAVRSNEKKIKNVFLERKKKYAEIAVSRKHEAEKLTNPHHVIVTNVELIVNFVISFSYEDKMRNLDRLLPLEKQWSLLIPYLSAVVTKLERSKATSEPMLGVCYQIRATVYLHLKMVVEKRITRVSKRQDENEDLEDFNQKLVSLYQLQSKYSENSVADFLKGERYLSYSKLEASLPKTKSLNMKYQQRFFKGDSPGKLMIEWFTLKNEELYHDAIQSKGEEGLIRKLEAEKVELKMFYLPFNLYLGVEQVVGYACSVIREYEASHG